MLDKLKWAKKTSATVQSYQKVFDTPDGKVVLHDLMKHCHMLQSTYTGKSEDSAYNEGQRAVVLRILSLLKTDHGKLLKHLEEIEKEKDNESI